MTKAEERRLFLQQQNITSTATPATEPVISKADQRRIQLQQVQQPVTQATQQNVQPIRSHGQVAQQGMQATQEKFHATEKPMTAKIQSGQALTPAETIRFAEEQGVAQDKINKAKKNLEYNSSLNSFSKYNDEIAENNLLNEVNSKKYFEYQDKRDEAKAKGNLKEESLYQSLLDKMDQTYKPMTKDWYNIQKPDTDFLLGQIEQRVYDVRRDEKALTEAKTYEEQVKAAEEYKKTYQRYQDAVKKYQDALLYEKYNNNPVLDQLDILAYTGANTLANLMEGMGRDARNNNETLRGVGYSNIKPSELLAYNNEVKNGNAQYALINSPLKLNALRYQAEKENASKEIKDLYQQISTGTFSGTEQDIQRIIDDENDAQNKFQRREEIEGQLQRKKEKFDWKYEPNPAAKKVLEATEQVTAMIPTLGATALNPALGDLAMYQFAGNQAYNRARANGATVEQAETNKALKGSAEAAFEHLVTSSIDKAVGRAGLLAPSEWAGQITNPVLRTGVGLTVDAVGEGLEEIPSTVLDPIIDRITYNPNAPLATKEEIWGSFADSILPTLMLSGTGLAIQGIETYATNATNRVNNSNLTDLQKAEFINQIENGRKEFIKQINERKAEIDAQEQNNQIAREAEALNLQPQQTAQNNTTIANQVAELNKKGFNIPQSTTNTLQAIQDVRGTRIEFDDTIDGNGVYDAKNRTIYLNPTQHARAIEFTIAHELGHDIKAGNLEDYNKLQKAVLDYATKQKGYTEGMQALDNTYRSKLGEGNYDIKDEMTNDILGEVLGNQEFLDSLAQKQPNLFQKVWNWIKNVLIDNTNGRLSFEERRMLNKYEQGFRNAYQKAFNGTQQQGTQQSLSEDGLPIVRTLNNSQLKNLAKATGSEMSYIEANIEDADIDEAKNFIVRHTNLVDNYIKEKGINIEKSYKPVEFSRVRGEKLHQFVKDNNINVAKLANNSDLLNEYLDLWFEDYPPQLVEENKEKWKDIFEAGKEPAYMPSVLKSFEREFQYINNNVNQIEDTASLDEAKDKIIKSQDFQNYLNNILDGVYEKNTYEPDDVMEEAIANHGTTNNYNTGAYMTTDGQLLDFYDGGYTRDDHRTVDAFGMNMTDFIGYGAIRMKPELNGFELSQEPTEAQYDRLEDYINTHVQNNPDGGKISIDIDKDGKTVDGATYDRNTPADVIIRDLKQYFRTGKFPVKSKYADFYYSKPNPSWQSFLDETFGKWNRGTKTNFESLPTNEELKKAETKSVENDAKALNLEPEQPKKKRLTQQERDANVQKEIEKRVIDAVGDNFDNEVLVPRLQAEIEKADKAMAQIDKHKRKTSTDEDNWKINHTVSNLLDDYLIDIRRGKDIRNDEVYKAYKYGYEPITKMSTNTSLENLRDFKEVGNKKVKAYQYENPEVKPFFQHEARNMLQDLNNAVKGEKSATWNDYGELRYTGTSRETTQDIADLLDGNNGVKLSYEDIRKGLNAIINDKGSENIAAAKRIEMVLDKRLREGYTDSYGDSYEPNENYLNFLAGKDFIEPAEYERQVAERMATEDGTLFSLSEEQQNEVNDYIHKLTNDTTIDDNFKDQILTRFDNLTDYKQFENIKQDVEDYKEKAYQGIKSLVDVANMKPEDVKQRPMEYTQRKDKNTSNQRKFFDNMETSNIIADETKNRVNATTYEQKANLDTLEQVRQKLDERGNDMIEEWKHKTKNFTDKDVALGAILIERYQQAGDWNSAARAIEKLADMGTEAGRAVQMYSIFQRLSPETMALYQQKELDKAFEEMKQRKTGKWVEANKDKYKLTAEDTQFIYEQVEKAAQAIDDETKQRELSKIENRINDKLPPEDGQAIKALRRIAMLFNPKTQVRNIVGNTLIMPVNDIADVIGAGIDRIVARKTGTRTTGLPNPITKAKGFAKGVKSAVTDYKTGTRTTGSGSKYEFDIGAKPFNENTDSKVKNAINNKLNGINNLLSAVMSGGDRPFYEAAYKNSLESQMKANKVKEPTQDMIDIAVNEALQRTWNDDNEYTKFVLGLRKAFNNKYMSIHGFGFGDLILPFAKTPANLTKAMVEYSPAGFIGAALNYADMSRAISRGEMTPQQQKKFVSSMSKAIAGTLLYAFAGTLVKAGKITGSAEDDKDVRNFEQNVLGIQPYSVRLGDKTYTYSWANPINAPLAIMADSYKMSKEDAKLYDQLYNAVKVAGNVLLDNSFLQGISDIFTHQEGPVAGIIESIMSMPESMIPTFLSQIASLGDDTQRQTYEYKNKGQSVINRVKNKIPGARNTLEPKVNTFGEEIENQNNLFNAFLNPANVREARTTEAQKEIYSLYEATGDKTIFPMQAPNSVTKNGNTENLTNKQKVRYQKGSGQYATEVYGDLFDSDYYDSISNTQKTDLLQRVAQDANKMGKTEVGVWTEDTFKVDERYNELEDRGIPLADYYIAWSAQKDVTSDKDENGKTITLSASRKKKEAIDDAVDNLNKKQMEYLYGIFDISEKVW